MYASAWKNDMKKTILSFIIALTACMSVWAGIPAKMEKLARQYKGQEGFEVVSMGRLGLSLLKGAAVISGDMDEEDRAALKMLDSIKKLLVVDFEDAPSSAKTRFASQVEKMLVGMELVMEMHDSDATVRIYGIEDGSCIKDCILYSSDGALICIDGSIEMESVGALMKE